MKRLLILIVLSTSTFAVAQTDLYSVVLSNDNIPQLWRLPGADPSQAEVVGNTTVQATWLEYDPTTDTFITRDWGNDSLYRIDRYTGATTPFDVPIPSGVGVQGIAYVPTRDEILVVTGDVIGGNQRDISILNTDGSLSPLFSSLPVTDLDDLCWDPVRSKLYATDASNTLHTIDEITGDVLDTQTLDSAGGILASVSPSDGWLYTSFTFDFMIRSYDPTSATLLEEVGILGDVNKISGLAFVPEPSGLTLLLGLTLCALRRRH